MNRVVASHVFVAVVFVLVCERYFPRRASADDHDNVDLTGRHRGAQSDGRNLIPVTEAINLFQDQRSHWSHSFAPTPILNWKICKGFVLNFGHFREDILELLYFGTVEPRHPAGSQRNKLSLVTRMFTTYFGSNATTRRSSICALSLPIQLAMSSRLRKLPMVSFVTARRSAHVHSMDLTWHRGGGVPEQLMVNALDFLHETFHVPQHHSKQSIIPLFFFGPPVVRCDAELDDVGVVGMEPWVSELVVGGRVCMFHYVHFESVPTEGGKRTTNHESGGSSYASRSRRKHCVAAADMWRHSISLLLSKAPSCEHVRIALDPPQ